MTSPIDLASCLATIPDRRRAEGKIYGQAGLWKNRKETALYVSSDMLPAETFASAICNHCGFTVSFSGGHWGVSVARFTAVKFAGAFFLRIRQSSSRKLTSSIQCMLAFSPS